MLRHIESVHERTKLFKCQLCDFGYATKKSLNKHFSFAHEGKKIENSDQELKEFPESLEDSDQIKK